MAKSRVRVLASLCSLLRLPSQGVARCLAMAVLAMAGVSVSASSAHAADDTTCTGSSATTASPGLTFTPRTVSYTVTDTYSTCVSTDSSLTAGGFSIGATTVASCNGGVSLIPSNSITISWNNSQSSTVLLTTVTNVILAGTEQVTGVGTVTSGEFIGGDVTIVWLYPVINPLQCLTSQGLTGQSGTVALEIVVP